MNVTQSVDVTDGPIEWAAFLPDAQVICATRRMENIIERKCTIKAMDRATTPAAGATARARSLLQLIRKICRSKSDGIANLQWQVDWRQGKKSVCAMCMVRMPSRTVPGLLVVIPLAPKAYPAQSHDESKAQLQAIIETAVDGIVTIDAKGQIETFNPAAETIFGYRAGEVIGKPVSILMPEPFKSEHAHYVNRYLKTRERHIIGIGREVIGRRKNGGTFPMFLSVGEQHVAGQIKFTGIVRDITDRKRAEAQVLLVSERVQQRLGHDLHDGLGQVLTGASLLAKALQTRCGDRCPDLSDQLQHLVDIMADAAGQVRKLSRGLLPLQQVEDYTPSIDSLRLRLAGTAVEMAVHVENLPREAGLLHANNLFRIAQEAVSNALRHSRATRISIISKTAGRTVRLVIEDNGRGFARSGSRGLGLHIMDYRARLMGGQLAVHSEPGRGTRVVCNVDCGITTGEIGESINEQNHRPHATGARAHSGHRR